jgi:glycosyltransferase involved in cell wall biosynthesis
VNERHAVLLFSYCQVPEQLELCKGAVASILRQDIGLLDVLLVDNGSTQPVAEWFQYIHGLDNDQDVQHRIHTIRNRENVSPVKLCNRALAYLWSLGHEKVLCVADDVVLPANAYRLMNQWPRGMVCASMTEQREFPVTEEVHAVNECTPMALGIVRKWFYDALVAKDGYYLDEGYFHYASDCDMALRMAACGIRGVQLDLQYFHHGSASWRLLSESDGRKLTDVADIDREYFFKKWGFRVFDEQYVASALDINFRGEQIPTYQRAAAASGDSK